jgi:hypothetical protein
VFSKKKKKKKKKKTKTKQNFFTYLLKAEVTLGKGEMSDCPRGPDLTPKLGLIPKNLRPL